MSQSRYEAYKDSGVAWLGQVPAHWEVRKIKSIAKFSSGGTPSRDDLSFWNGDIPWVSAKDMKSQYINGSEECITQSGLLHTSGSLIPEGSVLMVVRSGILKHTIPVAINVVPVTINQDLKCIVLTNDCTNIFLYYWIVGNNNLLLHLWSKQGATVESIEHEYMVNTLIPLPPLAEQQAIAAFLDRECARIDALVAAQQRMIALSKEKRRALIAHVVTQGLDPAAPRKDSGVAWLGQVPAHWEVKRLKTNADIIPSNIDKKSYDDELPIQLCNYTDVYYNDIIVPEMPFMQATASQEQIHKFSLKAGDIIVTKDSETADDIAIPAYVPQTIPNVVCGYHLALIRITNGIIGKYLFYYFLSVQAKSYFETRANGLTRVGLGQAAIGNLPLPLPPLAEQQAIAVFLDRECARIDALISKAEQAIVLLRERRSALIAAAVTGQIRVDNEK